MYPTYALQVYDYVQEKWVPTAYEASNRPHHYDILRQAFDRLVSSASDGSPNQKPIGYKIVCDGRPVDTWTNGKVSTKRPVGRPPREDGRDRRLFSVRVNKTEYAWILKNTDVDTRRRALLEAAERNYNGRAQSDNPMVQLLVATTPHP